LIWFEINNKKSKNMKPITQYPFPENQYIRTETEKVQIYLHHTAGNPDPIGTFEWWASTPERIATCIAIGGKPGRSGNWKDGEIVQGFSSKYWAYHLGLKEEIFDFYGLPYKSLDKLSIAVEVCNWGQLKRDDNGVLVFWNYVNRAVPPEEVCELEVPYKGYKYYHAYSDEQIDSLFQLLKFWEQKYGRDLSYNEDIWSVTKRALRGEPGLYTHTSIRKDKNDMSPQPKLIAMLKSL
jgi:hypothetical protein